MVKIAYVSLWAWWEQFDGKGGGKVDDKKLITKLSVRKLIRILLLKFINSCKHGLTNLKFILVQDMFVYVVCK